MGARCVAILLLGLFIRILGASSGSRNWSLKNTIPFSPKIGLVGLICGFIEKSRGQSPEGRR